MKYFLRCLIWLIVIFAIFVVVRTILRPSVIVHKALNDPRLVEFKRCKLLGYEYKLPEYRTIDYYTWLNPEISEIVFHFTDTYSRFTVNYDYKIYTKLEKNKISKASFENIFSLQPDSTVKKLIEKIENDSLLSEILGFAKIDGCKYDKNFLLKFSGANNEVYYSPTPYKLCQGVVEFSLYDIPKRIKSSPQVSKFVEMLHDKGFKLQDLYRIVYIRKSPVTWFVRGFIEECGSDVLQVGYGHEYNKVKLRWLSNPDTINPKFLEPQVYRKLLGTDLPEWYIEERFKLKEMGALREADYYKSDDRVTEISRIRGYYQYHWTTGTWIDEMHGGLNLKIYFTYFMNRDSIEMVRFPAKEKRCVYKRITLHPIKKIVSLNEIKEKISTIETTKIKYKIDRGGMVWLIFDDKDYKYKIELETGTIEKEEKYKGKTCVLLAYPYDYYYYSGTDAKISERRKRKKINPKVKAEPILY